MELEELRKNIDSIDSKIVELLNERYKNVIEVGNWKKERGKAVYVPEREKAVFDKVASLNNGPMAPSTLRAIYREIMSGSLSLEYPIRIAYLGPEATFTHLAAISRFGRSVGYCAKSSLEDIFNDVTANRCEYGCVPVENSTEGVVNHTLDMFTDHPDITICAEINMRIRHCLMANCPMDKIKRVYAHAQTHSQCRGFIRERMRGVEIIECASNTRAAEIAAKEDFAAAIAPSLASEVYGLDMLCENIEDNPNNTTRFLVITRNGNVSKPTGHDKTSICFTIKDRVGALYDCLLPFKEHEVTLTMIESRPSKQRNWEYSFFIDMLGHIEDADVKSAFEKLECLTSSLRVLGSYPCAPTETTL